MNKNTNEIPNTKNTDSIMSDNKSETSTESIKQHLVMLLEKKKLTRADVIFSSNLSKSYVYQVLRAKNNQKEIKHSRYALA